MSFACFSNNLLIVATTPRLGVTTLSYQMLGKIIPSLQLSSATLLAAKDSERAIKSHFQFVVLDCRCHKHCPPFVGVWFSHWKLSHINRWVLPGMLERCFIRNGRWTFQILWCFTELMKYFLKYGWIDVWIDKRSWGVRCWF